MTIEERIVACAEEITNQRHQLSYMLSGNDAESTIRQILAERFGASEPESRLQTFVGVIAIVDFYEKSPYTFAAMKVALTQYLTDPVMTGEQWLRLKFPNSFTEPAAKEPPEQSEQRATMETRHSLHCCESEETQISRLAQFIIDEVPGEPSQSEGAVDTAIRIIRRLRSHHPPIATDFEIIANATSLIITTAQHVPLDSEEAQIQIGSLVKRAIERAQKEQLSADYGDYMEWRDTELLAYLKTEGLTGLLLKDGLLEEIAYRCWKAGQRASAPSPVTHKENE